MAFLSSRILIFSKTMGFFLETEPVQPDFLIEETPQIDLCGISFRVLLVPGHCPGSLCFYSADNEILFDGDVLFAGSIGRTDFPGGDHQTADSRHSRKDSDFAGQNRGTARARTSNDHRRRATEQSISSDRSADRSVPPINSVPTGFQSRSAPSDARSRQFYHPYRPEKRLEWP